MAIFKARGDRYEPGSKGARVIRGDTGAVITKYQSQSDAAKNLGYASQSALEKFRAKLKNKALYQRQLADALRNGFTAAEFNRASIELQGERQAGNVNMSPTGALARINTMRGIRAGDADYSVGDTPSVK